MTKKISQGFFFGSAVLFLAVVFTFFGCQTNKKNDQTDTKLLFQGRSSLRLTAKDGTVMYVDPFAPGDYDLPADIILVTHDHPDHNQVDLVTQKPGCVVITQNEALEGGKHNIFTIKGIAIEAVEAYNDWHKITEAVGYIITIDGIKVYASGDTSTTGQMASFNSKKIDYAFFCCDGVFNMDGEEAAACARVIGAKHNIPYHAHPDFPDGMFDQETAERFTAPNRLILVPGQEITLTS